MELLAFTHSAVAYEDLTPTPELRSFGSIGWSVPSSAWIKFLSATVLVSAISAIPISTYAVPPLCRIGDVGGPVYDIQRVLKAQGYYYGPVNGYYDDATSDAVYAFQIDYGLFPDGAAGPQTLEAMGLGDAEGASTGYYCSAGNTYPGYPGGYPGGNISTGGTVTITAKSGLNVRTAPQILPYNIITALPYGTVANYTTASGDWLYLPSYAGWVDGYYTTKGGGTSTIGDTTIPSSTVLYPGDEGSGVAALQGALGSKGYYPGPFDGVYGPGTTQAVSNFQRDSGLFIDGIAGPQTIAALGPAYAVPYGTNTINVSNTGNINNVIVPPVTRPPGNISGLPQSGIAEVKVTPGSVVVRAEASRYSAAVTTVWGGTQVTYSSVDTKPSGETWYYLSDYGGWVSGNYLTLLSR